METPWFCDSAPGGGVSPPLKCGARFPSMGISVPSPFSISGDYSADIGDRAMITPGTNPVLPTDPAKRAAFLGFNSKGTVKFNGDTCVSGLPVPSGNTDKISISCWLAVDGAGQGALLRSPFSTRGPNPALFCIAPLLGSTPSGNVGNAMLDFRGCASGTVAAEQDMTTSDFTNQTGDYAHLMISIQASGNNPAVTVFINDTQIYNAHVLSSGQAVAWTIPFGLMTDGTPPNQAVIPNGGGQNLYCVGGPWEAAKGDIVNFVGAVPQGGNGMIAAATELWISFGHFVDWSNAANRNAFHTRDATLSHYVPVNLGKNGAAIGFKPNVYCTGGIANFTKNRANGNRLRLFGGSGDTAFVPGEGEVPTMISDDRVPGL